MSMSVQSGNIIHRRLIVYMYMLLVLILFFLSRSRFLLCIPWFLLFFWKRVCCILLVIVVIPCCLRCIENTMDMWLSYSCTSLLKHNIASKQLTNYISDHLIQHAKKASYTSDSVVTYHGTDSHYPCTHPTSLNAMKKSTILITDVSVIKAPKQIYTRNFDLLECVSTDTCTSCVKWHLLARFATQKLTLPKPLLNGFLEELAGGGVVMVKSLLSQLLHRYI